MRGRGGGGGKGGEGKERAFQPITNFLFKSSTDDPKSHLPSFVKKPENMVKIILWVVNSAFTYPVYALATPL